VKQIAFYGIALGVGMHWQRSVPCLVHNAHIKSFEMWKSSVFWFLLMRAILHEKSIRHSSRKINQKKNMQVL